MLQPHAQTMSRPRLRHETEARQQARGSSRLRRGRETMNGSGVVAICPSSYSAVPYTACRGFAPW